jgi:hypothetical protein
MTWAGWGRLAAPRVTSAALARACPAEHAGAGRSCVRRGRRWGSGPGRAPAPRSPALTLPAPPAEARAPDEAPRALAPRYAPPWGLCTTASTGAQAGAEYAGRMSSKETYGAWPHHWAGRGAVGGRPTEARGARLSGGVCLAETVPRPRGQRVRREPRSPQRRAPWTATARSSWCGGGQRLGTAPGSDGRSWRAQQGERLGQLGTTAPAPSRSETAALAVLEEAA